MTRYILTAVLVLGAASQAGAQVAATQQPTSSTVTLASIGMYIYPAQDQSPEQQRADEAACTDWAEAQTGLTLQAGSVDTQAAAQQAQQQAEAGAAQQGAAQAQAQNDQAIASFKQAAGACLSGRGYTVN